MKVAGILGGLGPLAGAYFYTRLVEFTPAKNDNEHIPVLIVSDPNIPSRIAHLSGTGISPVPKLLEICDRLVEGGADFIVMPSTTTSIYLPELAEKVPIPMLSLLEEVAHAIDEAGCRRVAILGTTPTKTFHVYDKAFASHNLISVYPDDAAQEEIMDVILSVKGSGRVNRSEETDSDDFMVGLRSRIADVVSRDWARDIDAVLLGCTELPVLFPGMYVNKPLGVFRRKVFSSTDVLARATVERAFSS